jgi:hypothetical protein
MMLPVLAAAAVFPPLQKARIENLAGTAPAPLGLELTH